MPAQVPSSPSRRQTGHSRSRLRLTRVSACPRRSVKRNEGQRDVTVRFAGLVVQPGDYLYADEDGMITSTERLHDSVPQ